MKKIEIISNLYFRIWDKFNEPIGKGFDDKAIHKN